MRVTKFQSACIWATLMLMCVTCFVLLANKRQMQPVTVRIVPSVTNVTQVTPQRQAQIESGAALPEYGGLNRPRK